MTAVRSRLLAAGASERVEVELVGFRECRCFWVAIWACPSRTRTDDVHTSRRWVGDPGEGVEVALFGVGQRVQVSLGGLDQ